MIFKALLVSAVVWQFPLPAFAVDCSNLDAEFKRYDTALSAIENESIFDDSAPRESNRQGAVANILARKQIILDMMIYMECDMPDMVGFSLNGLIGLKNTE